MTLTPEQIKEAVELADGWSWIADMVADANGIAIAMNQNYGIAALASQLISQVDATDYGFESHPDGTALIHYGEVNVLVVDGPNRDENSILACTEFLKNHNDTTSEGEGE